MRRPPGILFVVALALLVGACQPDIADIPDRARHHFERANEAYEKKDYAGAIQGFQAVVDVYSYTRLYPIALYRLAYSKLKVGRFAEAEADFADFLKEFPHHELAEDAHVLYAKALSQQERYFEAAYALAKIAADPDNRLAETALEGFIEHFEVLDREKRRQLLDEFEDTYLGAYLLYTLGLEAYERGDMETAALHLRRLTEHPLATEFRDKAPALLAEVTETMARRPKVIGCLVPLTGDMAPYGREVRSAVEVAAAEYNAAHSRKLEVVVADSQGTAEGAVRALRSLAEESQAIVVIGPLSSTAFRACIPWAEEYQLPLVTPAATEIDLAALSSYAFRNALTYENQCETLAEFCSERLHLDRFGILYEDTAYGEGMREAFNLIAPRYGISVVVEQSYPLEDKSYTDECRVFRKLGLDAIFIPGHQPTLTELAAQLVYYGIVAELIGGNGWNAESVTRMGLRYVEGAIFCDAIFTRSRRPEVRSFIIAYRAHGASDPSYLAAHAYDTFGIIATALDSGAVSRPDLAERLLQVRRYPGIIGETSFDADGEAHKPLTILTILENEIIEFGTSYFDW
ncbi:ABC transporter substrate-binding protein [bacterium]|nr:ABC transporter substrate-binding protein [bacterium]